MSTTLDARHRATEPPEPSSQSPSEPEHPFRGLKQGWARVPRSPRRADTTVESVLVIELDPERTAWVFAEAARSGVNEQPQRVIEALIDAARKADRD